MTQPTHRSAGKRPGRPGASASNSTTTSTPLSPSTKRPGLYTRPHASRSSPPLTRRATRSSASPRNSLHAGSTSTPELKQHGHDPGRYRALRGLPDGKPCEGRIDVPPRPTAMLYMPMRNVTTRRDDEQTGFTFDQPSSQLGSLDNPARIRALGHRAHQVACGDHRDQTLPMSTASADTSCACILRATDASVSVGSQARSAGRSRYSILIAGPSALSGHQFAGGSLAGNDCRPHSSTRSAKSGL